MTKQEARSLTIAGNTRKQCWITYNGNVYDVTEFLEDHPGGDDLILNVAGGDVGTIMADPTSHAHSTSAYEMLEEFKIGELGGDEKIVDRKSVV